MDSDGEDDRPPLLRAAYASDLHALRRAIADGADVNVANEDGFTALDLIINWGDDDNRFECIEALVEAGADVNRLVGTRFDEDEDEGEDVSTPLLDALFSFRDQPTKCQAVTTLLLRAGADVRRSIPRGMTPLHIAAMWGLAHMIVTSGWEAYRRAHVDKLALLFTPKPETGKGRRRSKRRRSPLHGLPPELVRRVVEYWAHAGYPVSSCDQYSRTTN